MGVLPFRFELPSGVATVIGALPPLPAIDAARFALDRVPRLPGTDIAIDLRDGVDALLSGSSASADPDGELYAGLRTFLESVRGRIEPIVVTLTGPVTLDLALRERGVDAAESTALAIAEVQTRARTALGLADRLVPAPPVLVFLQEPGLERSMHPAFPLAPEQIEAVVSEVVSDIAELAMVGIQVAGRADWAMLLRTGISVLGAPVTARLETAAEEIRSFLESGGFMAWGAVPVDEPFGASTDRLWRRLSSLWCELVQAGNDPALLRERSIITPASGLANFGLPQAERVVGLAQEIATKVVTQTFGVRLSMGA